MQQAIEHFPISGRAVTCERYGEGHINQTYLVETDSGAKYILQRLSNVAFHDIPGLMDNIIRVTQHIAAKTDREDGTLHFLPSDGGKYYHVDDEGYSWRCYRFVDALCIQAPESEEDFYQSATRLTGTGSFARRCRPTGAGERRMLRRRSPSISKGKRRAAHCSACWTPESCPCG